MSRKLGLVAVLLGSMLLVGCGSSYSHKVALIKEVVQPPATALAIVDSRAYVAAEDGKLRVYDLTDLGAMRGNSHQADAFSGKHVALVPFLSNTRMLLVADDGRVSIISIETPATPTSEWGSEKSARLLPKGGRLVINELANQAFLTTTNASAGVVRLDLGRLTSFVSAADAEAAKASLVKSFAGGGGGGIVLPVRSSNRSPTGRLCVGNMSTGKVDLWLLSELASAAGTKPQDTIALSAGISGKPSFLLSMDRYLMVASATAVEGETDWAMLDLGRDFAKVNEPNTLGAAKLGGVYRAQWESGCPTGITCRQGLSCVNQVCRQTCKSRADCPGSDCTEGYCGGKGPRRLRMVTSGLKIWSLGERIGEPAAIAVADLAGELDLRDMVIRGDYIYTAEKQGFRVYKISAEAK